MKKTLEIRWWIFEEISNRASKYNWAIDCKVGKETTYAYQTMLVKGFIVAESEKAYKVELDYTKLADKERKVYSGFTAWIPKKSIINFDAIELMLAEEEAQRGDDIIADDLRTYCSCGVE